MSALDRIKAQGARERGSVSVPEWGETKAQPLVIHFRPVTLNDVAASIRVAPDNPVRQNVEMFCMVAQNADGTPMFKRIDAIDLMEQADPQILGRVMREMGIVHDASVADVEKN